MQLLDEQGRLFGVVNVVDLLAVLLALAVVVAGVAVVLQPDGSSESPELVTRHVTLDLGSQPEYVTERISAGDVAPLGDGPGNLTVTDVFVTPGGGGGSSVTVRARVRGQLEENTEGESPTVRLAGGPLVLGRQLSVATSEYRVGGVVTAVEPSGESLDVSTTDVVLTTTMPADVVADISEGDRARASGQNVATVESVTVYPTGNPTRRQLHLGLSLQTITRQERVQFGGTPVGVGRTLAVPFERYDVRGQVSAVGRLEPAGDVETTRAVVRLSNVPPERAANVRQGMTETVGRTQYARVLSKRVEPAEVVLRSQDGNIFVRDHPRNVDVSLTVDLQTRATTTGLRFHGRPLRLNDQITLALGPVTVRVEVIRIR
ncbi:MAG: DUF4330 family protein [Haloferacaceae archaeon]